MSAPTLPLLLEIGCEEIPARFLAQAQRDLGERLHAALEEARLLEEKSEARSQESEVTSSRDEIRNSKLETRSNSEFRTQNSELCRELRTPNSELQTYSTPRRLVACIPVLLARQPDKAEEVTGPPVKVAYGKDGRPTRAAESFAAKAGVGVKDLYRLTTPKGEYLAGRKTTVGRPALQVLSEILPGVITGLAFPKSMYWEETKTRWVRPIRWILALLGEGSEPLVIPFEVAGVKSGNVTYCQRASQGRNSKLENRNSKTEIGPPHFEFRVSSFDDYAARLRQMGVEFDPAKRRERVRHQIKVLLEDSGFSILPDEDLEEWIVNSTEWPHALLGSFEDRFLKLPREILITVMRDHQKYFAVSRGFHRESNLAPCFVTVLNVPGDPTGIIRHGHERVLTARFADAEFFWNADQKVSLRDRLPMLERVTYQAKLGSYGDKVRRMETITKEICGMLRPQGRLTEQEQHALRAAQLCKCDLTTQMVQEFPELQGIVGGLYANAQGEPKEVWQAIYDHYLPQGPDDRTPRTTEGAVVSLADKMDSVLAAFSAGLEPTGSSDPFGLRRAGNGTIRIVAEVLAGIDILALLDKVVHIRLAPPSGDDLLRKVSTFLRERTEHYLGEREGLRHDTVRAVVYSFKGWSPPFNALQRGKALDPFIDTEDFQVLALAAKRTRNILSKSGALNDREMRKGVNRELLAPGPELELYAAYESVSDRLKDLEKRGRYGEAFHALAGMRPFVDRFFDSVLVMDENPELRANRLRLLNALNDLVFSRFADLSQIESNTSIVGAPTAGYDPRGRFHQKT